MKKLLYLIIAIFAITCLWGCSNDEAPGQIVSNPDDYVFSSPGVTLPITIKGHTKYLWLRGDQAGIADDDDCSCHEERMNRLIDSIRKIVQEEVRVRVILSREER